MKTPTLTKETEKKIVDRWRYYPDNSVAQLAKEFECSEMQVHRCINNYLKTKQLCG